VAVRRRCRTLMTETAPIKNSESKTVLVVEDESLLREMESSILQGCGYQVLEAESGRKALDVWDAKGDKIDLLLTDVMLPRGISGLELARRLYNRRPRLKIIFTTGHITRESDQEMMGRMRAHFLQKPYQHSDLVRLVHDVLEETERKNVTEPAT
jgi:CheY-like chemotaxis protein